MKIKRLFYFFMISSLLIGQTRAVPPALIKTGIVGGTMALGGLLGVGAQIVVKKIKKDNADHLDNHSRFAWMKGAGIGAIVFLVPGIGINYLLSKKFPHIFSKEKNRKLPHDLLKGDKKIGGNEKKLKKIILNGDKKLAHALENNSAQEINDLAAQGFDFNQPQAYTDRHNLDQTETALVRAIEGGKDAVVDALLKIPGIDINTSSKWRSPILAAMDADNLPALEKLLAAGADTNVSPEFGFSPLTHALGKKDLSFADLLLKHGAIPAIDEALRLAEKRKDFAGYERLLIQERERLTANHDAQTAKIEFQKIVNDQISNFWDCETDAEHENLFKILRAHGMDLNAKGCRPRGLEPLFYQWIRWLDSPKGTYYAKYQVLSKLFVENGVDCTIVSSLQYYDFKNPNGLQLAVAVKAFDLAELMLKRGTPGNYLAAKEYQAILAGIDKAKYPLLAQCRN